MSTDNTVARKYLDFQKFSLFAAAPGTEGRRARLMWNLSNGNPRLVVFTGDPAAKGQAGIINAPMDPVTFYSFLDMFERTIRSKDEVKFKVDCFTSIRDQETKKVTGKQLLSEIWFGKDANGIVWISVVAEHKPKIRFDYEVYEYHNFYKADGTKMSATEGSVLSANATLTAIRGIYNNLMTTSIIALADEKEAMKGQPKGKGGGFGSPGSLPSDMDDLTF